MSHVACRMAHFARRILHGACRMLHVAHSHATCHMGMYAWVCMASHAACRGHYDDDGYFWFSSRDDDVIITAGYRVGPFEVESALLEHPAVAESAVVACPGIVKLDAQGVR